MDTGTSTQHRLTCHGAQAGVEEIFILGGFCCAKQLCSLQQQCQVTRFTQFNSPLIIQQHNKCSSCLQTSVQMFASVPRLCIQTLKHPMNLTRKLGSYCCKETRFWTRRLFTQGHVFNLPSEALNSRTRELDHKPTPFAMFATTLSISNL